MKLEIENSREKPCKVHRKKPLVEEDRNPSMILFNSRSTLNLEHFNELKILSPVCKPASYIASFLSSHLLPLILLVANRFRLVDFGLAMKVPGSTCSLLGRY